MIDASRNPKTEKRIELLTKALNGEPFEQWILKQEEFSGDHPNVKEVKSHRWHKHMPTDEVLDAKHRRCGISTEYVINIIDKRTYVTTKVWRCKDFRCCDNCRKVRQEWAVENFNQQAKDMGALVIIDTPADVTPFVRAMKGKANYQRMPHANGNVVIVPAELYEKHQDKIKGQRTAFNVDDELSRKELANVIGETLVELPLGKRSSGAMFDLIRNPFKPTEAEYKKEEIETIRVNRFVVEASVNNIAQNVIKETQPALNTIVDMFVSSELDLTDVKYAQECQLMLEAHLCKVLTETIGFDKFFTDDKYKRVPNPFVEIPKHLKYDPGEVPF